MLLQFSVENHLSFREPVTLSMVAPAGATGAVVRRGAPPITTIAAIYGANASGKSNVLKALRFAVDLVTRGVPAGGKIDNNAFRLSTATRDAPTRLQLDVRLPEGDFSYGLAVTADEVVEEFLVRDEIAVFEREGNAAPPSIGAAVSRADHELWGFVAKSTRPNQIFLHEAEDKNLTLVKPLCTWLRDRIHVVTPDAIDEFRMARLLAESPELLEFATSLLRRFGTGVDALSLEQVEVSGFRAALEMARRSGEVLRGERRTAPTAEGRVTAPMLRLQHRGEEDSHIPFRVSDESDGTRRLLELAPMAHTASLGQPRLFLIDELDRSLHPLLSRELLREFIAASQTPSLGPQLVFTTHDTNLLSADLLPPASIWFTEKSVSGATSVYSLAEYDPTQLEVLTKDLERGYLNGRFGAIPFVADPARLGWKRPENAL